MGGKIKCESAFLPGSVADSAQETIVSWYWYMETLIV